MKKSRPRTWISNAVILFLTLGVTFLLGEGVVRIIFGDSVALFPRYHTSAKYGDYRLRRIRPDLVFYHKSKDGRWKYTTNSKGFRDIDDVEYAKPAGVFRVVSLGDSHTQGYEVRQHLTYSGVLERFLARNEVPAEVINTGVSGFSTAEELVLLENEAIKYQPDAVVLGFYRNDFQDNVRSGLFGLSPSGELVVKSKEYLPGVKIQDLIYAIPGTKWLGENSHFYSILFNATWHMARARLTRSRTEDAFEYAVAVEGDQSDYNAELTFALLKRISRFCNENNLTLIIVDIPVYRDDGTIASSLPADIRESVEALADYFVDSVSILNEYVGIAEIHVPHGQRHISEFTHTMIGVAVGKALVGGRDELDTGFTRQFVVPGMPGGQLDDSREYSRQQQ